MFRSKPLRSRRFATLSSIVLFAACGGQPLAPVGTTLVPRPASSTATKANAPAASAAPVEPKAPEPKTPPPPGPELSTKQYVTWIWDKPRYGSQQIGFFRAGVRVPRSAEPIDKTNKEMQPCGGTWYRVEPLGFVCVGRDGVTLDLEDPIVLAAATYPARPEPLPFGYGMSVGSYMYARVPTLKEQKEVEGDVDGWRKRVAEGHAKLPPEKRPPEVAMPLAPLPSFLEGHAQAPAILPWLMANKTVRAGYIVPSTRLAFLTAFEVEGRPFYFTTEHMVVPADRVRAAKLSDFKGVELGDHGEKLPMVWARLPGDKIPATVYRLEGDTVIKTDVAIPEKGHAQIAQDDVLLKGARYHELIAPPAGLSAANGVRYVVKSNEATRLDVATAIPAGVQPNETWLEVNLSKQTLVIYEGLTPKFVTLISSGSGGKGHVTPFGHFRIYQKHISSRMSAEAKPPEKEGEEGEHAYRFDEVPWVQYIFGGIALHAAFWHDGFGLPRSHGCINLSPRDAQYVFGKTLPAMPKGWHGMMPGRGGIPMGTMVVVKG